MPFTQIALAAGSNEARDTAAGCARLINCYVEALGQDAKGPTAVYACDGWSDFSTLTSGGVTRGMINLDDTLLWVHSGGNLYSVDTGGTATNRGAVAVTGTAYFARNRASTPDIMMVSSDGLTRTISGTTVSTPSYAAGVGQADFNSVVGHDGYFVITKSDGEFYVSGLNAVTIDELDFAQAQTAVSGLIRGMAKGRDLHLFSAESMEIWQNVGAADFPYQRVHTTRFGTYAGPAMETIVGMVGGGMADTIVWPATGPDGGYIGIMMMNGYDATKVSNWQIDNAVRTATQANLRSYSYSSQGHSFYAITDLANWTYELNTTTGRWHERQGSGLAFAQTVGSAEFNGNTIFGDYTTGALYKLDTSVTPATASNVSVETSKDNGTTWTTARTKAVGTSGTTRTKFNGFGLSREDGWQIRLKVTSAYVEDGNDIDLTIIPPQVHATPYPLIMHTLYVDAVPRVGENANQKGMIQLGGNIERVRAA